MLINIGILLVGFLLLIKGADFFVEGASNVAKIFKIPAVVIGLTIVAFGTSAPEASVSIQAALNGSNDIALSNVIGSNIFNLAVCLGVSSVLVTLPVTKSIVKKDMPFLIFISALLMVFSFTDYQINRLEGMILLLLIIAYVGYMVRQVLQQDSSEHEEEASISVLKCMVYIAIGLAGIMYGGDFVVNSAQSIALTLGLSEKLVGLTIVSVGTSLPELVTSLVAARKKQVDIAVGNVVGSCIFNVLFILGSTTSILALNVDPTLMIDLLISFMIMIVVYLFSFKDYKITRGQGLFLLLMFVTYLSYIIIRN
ncbi:MAG: calcium/sodium antiporter [Erysipelotrichaceae bacterium]